MISKRVSLFLVSILFVFNAGFLVRAENEAELEGTEGAYPLLNPTRARSEDSARVTGIDGRVTTNVIVNCRDDGRRGNMQSEATIAVTPDVIVVAFNDSRGFFNPNTSVVGWGYSSDGGLGFADGQNLPAGSLIRNGDPWLVADANSNFWLSALYRSFAGVVVHEGSVSDGVVYWGDPLVAFESGSNTTDKDAIIVDNASGALYVTYTRPFAGRIELVKSTDAGLSWSAPRVVTSTSSNIGSIPIIGVNGEIYVVWENGWPSGSRNIKISKSTNGGDTFSLPVTISSLTTFPIPGFNRSSIADFPSIAIDKSGGPRNGTIYVAFHSRALGDADVFVASSTDGINWSTPVRANDDAVGNGALQFYPAISVDSAGNLGVLFFDRRNNPGTAWTDTYFARSTDGGQTFEENIKVTDVTSNWLATTSDAVPNFGDFIGLTTMDNAFYAAWGDGRNGDPDVFFAKITP